MPFEKVKRVNFMFCIFTTIEKTSANKRTHVEGPCTALQVYHTHKHAHPQVCTVLFSGGTDKAAHWNPIFGNRSTNKSTIPWLICLI